MVSFNFKSDVTSISFVVLLHLLGIFHVIIFECQGFTLPTSTQFGVKKHYEIIHNNNDVSRRSSSLFNNKNLNEDNSGGIFFDGPTDFKDRLSQSSSPSSSLDNKLRLEGSSTSSNTNPSSNNHKNIHTISKDVVIIGGGLAGLSIALQISISSNSNRQVTIIEKESHFQQMKKTPAASFAAAGMLAPHSERLPSGPLLDLCLQSRDMYSDFVSTVESITSNCSKEAQKYLWNQNDYENKKKQQQTTRGSLEPWEVGFAATGGFLAPAFAGDSVATWSPPSQVQSTAMWLDEIQVHEMEPSLHPDVIGGWWFPEDASVDARRLTCALRAACIDRGVQFIWGDDDDDNDGGVGSLELGNGKCKSIRLNDGRIVNANSVVVANGSWMRNLLPVPVTPHKGQSFSLRMPSNTEPLLSRILFAQDTYIVPKADGRIVVGATVEVGTFDNDVTPSGMMHCMANALQLVPGLSDLPVEETWAGLRPTTPDKGPILGRTKWDNLFLAGGYWRNGVLLAPKTGQLIADLVMNNGEKLDNEDDEALLQAFNWDRFTSPGGGKELAANARYAASMHPVHKRSSGIGVAASVGTELGFYSGADAAREERKRSRETLFQDISMSDDDEHAFEKAARLGLSDATAFSTFGDAVEKPRSKIVEPATEATEEVSSSSDAKTEAFDGYPDALTVGYESNDQVEITASTESTQSEEPSLDEIYKNIQKKKAEVQKMGVEMNQSEEEEKPDPGFRIYHVEKDTRKVREVPPYTSPTEFIANLTDEETDLKNELKNDEQMKVNKAESSAPMEESNGKYDETTFDGYQTIQKANSRTTREEELIAMKKARMSNRVDVSEIQRENIGAFSGSDTDQFNKSQEVKKNDTTDAPNKDSKDLDRIYDQILANKKNNTPSGGIEMERSETEERPDPGFRVYHVNKDTRDVTEVPPYTSPGDHLKSLESKKLEDNRSKEDAEHAWGE